MKIKRMSVESYQLEIDGNYEMMKSPKLEKSTGKMWCGLTESQSEKVNGRKAICVESNSIHLEVGEERDVEDFIGRKSTSGEKVQRSVDPTKLPKVSNNFSHTIELLMEEFENEDDSREFYRLYLIAKKRMDAKAILKQIEELQKKLDEMTK